MIDNSGGAGAVTVDGNGGTITLSYYGDSGTGTLRSDTQFPGGTLFSASIQPPPGNSVGVCTGMYASSTGYENDGQDEIDFEFLGNQRTNIQTNYFVNGVGSHEEIIDLGFDAFDTAHTYSFKYIPGNMIQWSVDGNVVRTVNYADGVPFPTQSMFLYFSNWDATHINNGIWAGSVDYSSGPFTATFSNVDMS